MNVTSLALGIATLAFTASTSADALSLAQEESRTAGNSAPIVIEETSPWYFHAAGGGNMMLNSDFENVDHTMKFGPGVAVDLGVGYSLNKIFAVQVQTGVAWNKIDSIDGADLSGGEGNVYQVPLTLHLVMGFPISDSWKLGFSAGGGIQWTNFDGSGRTNGSMAYSYSSQSYAFRYQLGVAATRTIAHNMTLGFGVRFSGTTSLDIGYNGEKVKGLTNIGLGATFKLTF